MPSLKVDIKDSAALASIRRSVIIDYLIEHGWQYTATFGQGQHYPYGRESLHTRYDTDPPRRIKVPASESFDDYPMGVYWVISALADAEDRSQLEIFDDMRYMAPSPKGTYPQPWDGWVCFHCGTRFRQREAALEHFGPTPDDNVARCLEDPASSERTKSLR